MKIEELKAHMDGRFDKIEENQVDFIKATTENKTDIHWIKGHLKVTVTIIMTVAGFLAAALFKTL